MFHPKAVLLLGLLALLGAETNNFQNKLQKVSKNDFGDGELALSMIVNQMALLKILNESPAISSLDERKLEEMQDLRLELDVKTEELKNDLLSMKDELKDMTATSLDEINTKKEELQNIAAAFLYDIATKKEELQNMIVASHDKIIRMIENAKQDLKKVVFNASQQPAAITTTIQPLECEDGWNKYQSSCYKVFDREDNYAMAAANCRSYGAYLASIGSEGENSFVNGLINKGTFIGLSDEEQEGVFKWDDGSPFRYSKWKSGEPNNHDGLEDCVYMYTDSYWNDNYCGYTWPSHICEKHLH